MNNDFHGLPTRRLENQHLRLEYLAEAGPRLVRLQPAGSDENLFAELPDLMVYTPYGEYNFRGGHRLWHAPEAMPGSYMPDNTGLKVEELPDGVRLLQPAEPGTGIGKSMEIHLEPDKPILYIHHELRNHGPEPVEMAPWAITQFKLGGTLILPQPAELADPAGLLPNRHLVLWPYTHWDDPRLGLNDDFILIHAQPKLPPLKLGYRNLHGWMGYWQSGLLFVKRFALLASQPYPDYGCNVETYCNDQFIELESLGPLCRLEPGQSTRHTETWELYHGLQVLNLPADIRALLE
jgi:hypothetical protein